jgi:ethanolaminephosphotransferase
MNRYITPEGEHAIRTFKYKGSNLSYSYSLLWSPFADQILKIVPASWAPNSITVAGLLIHTITTIILIMQGPFGSNAPAWSLWLHGVGLFLYFHLDNVDGKQARKLHNSTPLGMIMDHGCDALGLACLSVSMARIVCIDNFNLILYVFTFGVTFGFYVSAWCQYYSNGLMILGKFNAVDDGIPVIWISAFVSAIFGQDFWRTPITLLGETYPLNECIATTVAVAGISKPPLMQFRCIQ